MWGAAKSFARPIKNLWKNRKAVTAGRAVEEDIAKGMDRFGPNTDQRNVLDAARKAIPEYDVGKTNLGRAGTGAGVLGATGLGGYGIGHRTGNTEGFNEGGEAGWAGGQQAGKELAQKAFENQGFLQRLLGSVSPGSTDLTGGSQQAFNPEVLRILQNISQAIKSSK